MEEMKRNTNLQDIRPEIEESEEMYNVDMDYDPREQRRMLSSIGPGNLL